MSKALEKAGFRTDDVAMFLMRCLFTMFAEDVELLERGKFRDLLAACVKQPDIFPHAVGQLWEAMDKGDYAHAFQMRVRRFNGEFFAHRAVLPLGPEEIGELHEAAKANWREVEPAIFGTLVEQALDPAERKRLGAHYTPRAYVERLVVATIIEPLRTDWNRALATVERQKAEGRDKEAIATVQAFHDGLCRLRVLDPACGTGNFLYVALELLKRLEGEVLDALAALGGQESLVGLEGHTVDPRQFLGIELNPRAARIAELVLWIGYLQWHVRTKGGPPNDPILKAFHNIQNRDAVLTWDGYPLPQIVHGNETYPNPRRPAWPTADFIVGNPPFIGGKDIGGRLGRGYTATLWAAHPATNDSADFVMYWWDRAAELLTAKGTALRRLGFVTTNSISQVFQRRVVERHLTAKRPLSLVMAIPDHAWTKATPDSAAVRIAMTVAVAGEHEGLLREVTREAALDTDAPEVDLIDRRGRINADLTVGVDVTGAAPLRANEAICSPGVKLHGSGFIVRRTEAEYLGLGRVAGLDRHIRPYRNGRDLTSRPRGVLVIDLLGLSDDDVRHRFPAVYQHLLATVKPERDVNNRATYRDNWWLFGEPRRELRPALVGLRRYIATVETSKHRTFQFLDASILPDNMLVAVASDDALHLGVLSSRIHVVWALRAGGWLGVGNDPRYSKSRCFDPFPFPAADDLQRHRIRVLAEELDAHRKRVLEAHPHLTLTGLYNVLERLEGGATRADLDPGERRTFDDGLVLILRELHGKLDAVVASAYGWSADLAEDDILGRLVALNQERATEEARGHVLWLRPDYQPMRLGAAPDRAEQTEADLALPVAAVQKPSFPAADMEQTAVIMAALLATPSGLDAASLAGRFRQGRKVERKVHSVLHALRRVGLASRDEQGTTWRLRRVA